MNEIKKKEEEKEILLSPQFIEFIKKVSDNLCQNYELSLKNYEFFLQMLKNGDTRGATKEQLNVSLDLVLKSTRDMIEFVKTIGDLYDKQEKNKSARKRVLKEI